MVEQPRVFISSTIHALPDYRKDIIDACLRQGMEPLVENQKAEEKAVSLLNDANVYLGVFANHTNYRVLTENFDTVVGEYDRAIELNIPRLIFLMHDDDFIKPPVIEPHIPLEISGRLRAILLRCGPFGSDGELRACFVDERISPWRNKFPIAYSPESRVDAVVAYLLDQNNASHENALILLLRVLSERVSPVDICHDTLINLAHELEAVITPPRPNPDAIEISAYTKFETFKARLRVNEAVHFFHSSEELRTQIINNLSQFGTHSRWSLYPIQEIPIPPAPYIAHSYTLLQTHKLVGRRTELELLNSWISKPDTEIYQAPVLSIVAIGGMGKSALAWTWFNNIVSAHKKPVDGFIWWSFYEKDASFENFTICALSYVTGQPKESVRKLLPPERTSCLLRVLSQQAFLLVLDGLERILLAYTYDEFEPSLQDKYRLRQTIDPQAENFLRKLVDAKASRILISSRICPNALLNHVTYQPLKGNFILSLDGLSNQDALNLWRTFDVGGTPDILLPVFQTVSNHPLSIQSLAREVALYRYAPGNFDQWKKDHPNFNPGQLPLVQRQSHILEFALRGVDDNARKVLQFVGALCMPTDFKTLVALLVGENKVFPDDSSLDRTLTELEIRGLLGWDRVTNHYNLHPIVRAVTWEMFEESAKDSTFATLCLYFMQISLIQWQSVSHIQELTDAIELYNALIGIKSYDNAYDLFRDYLHPALNRLQNTTHRYITLLERLFSDGANALPSLENAQDQAWVLDALGQAYDVSGIPARAVELHQRQLPLREARKDWKNLGFALCNLSNALRLAGKLQASEAAAIKATSLALQCNDYFVASAGLKLQGLALLICGKTAEADALLHQALEIDVGNSYSQSEIATYIYLAQTELQSQNYTAAQSLINHAWQLATDTSNASITWRFNRGFIQMTRLRGMIALNTKDFEAAENELNEALLLARTESLVEEELQSLLGLAQLRKHQGDMKSAREVLDDIWGLTERGPYPIFRADAYNLLVDIEQHDGNIPATIHAATTAYRSSWCNGPTYSYRWGLDTARDYLTALGVSEPAMPSLSYVKEKIEIKKSQPTTIGNCIYCHKPVLLHPLRTEERGVLCSECKSPYHYECWQELVEKKKSHCGVLGCGSCQCIEYDSGESFIFEQPEAFINRLMQKFFTK